MVTHEGGTIPEENLVNYNADRVKTLGEAVLGLTLGCAQCHDHKYDPITQRDYYRLFAYFNTLERQGARRQRGMNPRPLFEAKTVLPATDVPALAKEDRGASTSNWRIHADADVAAWEDDAAARTAMRGKDFALHAVELLKVSTPNAGAGFDIDDGRLRADHRAGGQSGGVRRVAAVAASSIGPVTGLRIVFHPVADMPGGGWGFGQTCTTA